ncbi:MAG: 50S ribosomal protein L9 [Lachnospiraceae bacterium]|nr:50S ribosomal protein L9 [Lachnospiraceae bacterium]
MKVILLADVKSLGKKDDIVEVKEGYARNFLFTKKLGVPADSKNLNDVKVRKAVEEKQAKARLEEALDMKTKIEGITVTCSIKAGKDGKAFGSVSTKEIAEEAEKQHGIKLDKKKLLLTDPIKALGSYTVPVKLHPEVTAGLKVEVAGE